MADARKCEIGMTLAPLKHRTMKLLMEIEFGKLYSCIKSVFNFRFDGRN
jgi:hypothetical protein